MFVAGASVVIVTGICCHDLVNVSICEQDWCRRTGPNVLIKSYCLVVAEGCLPAFRRVGKWPYRFCPWRLHNRHQVAAASFMELATRQSISRF